MALRHNASACNNSLANEARVGIAIFVLEVIEEFGIATRRDSISLFSCEDIEKNVMAVSYYGHPRSQGLPLIQELRKTGRFILKTNLQIWTNISQAVCRCTMMCRKKTRGVPSSFDGEKELNYSPHLSIHTYIYIGINSSAPNTGMSLQKCAMPACQAEKYFQNQLYKVQIQTKTITTIATTD